MRIENSFVVPASSGDAWAALLNVESLVPCMPGATLESFDGDRIVGRLRVKLGPVTVAYGGTAEFVTKDPEAGRVVLRATGKERNGTGTAAAEITAQLVPEGAQTRVNVVTDLDITGRPAQFGRGVLDSVAQRLIGVFANNLAATMTAAPAAPVAPAAAPAPAAAAPGAAAPAAAAGPAAPASAGPVAGATPDAAEESLDLLSLVGLQRPAWAGYVPYAAIAVLSVLLLRSRRPARGCCAGCACCTGR